MAQARLRRTAQRSLAWGLRANRRNPRALSRPRNRQKQQGYLWACAQPKGNVIFRWETSRAARCLENILPADFHGKVQCDGYEAYECMARSRKGKVILGSCMAHIRRKIVEAKCQSPRIAAWLLLQIKNLYRIESKLRTTGPVPDCERR